MPNLGSLHSTFFLSHWLGRLKFLGIVVDLTSASLVEVHSGH